MLTSATARFSADDMGKLIHVMAASASGGPLTSRITVVHSRNQVELAHEAARSAPVLGGPNVNAVYGTDNARAFAAAFAECAAGVDDSPSKSVREYAPRRGVSLSAGAYLVGSALPPIVAAGLRLYGEGPRASIVYWCGSGALLQLDTFAADPKDAFGGTASGFQLLDLSLINPIERPLSYEGRRRSTGLQDNGSGSVMIENVQFAGLRYGFNGAYGSDFTRIGLNVGFSWCDVGCYFGPGSQQLFIGGTDFFACREGLVLEGAMQLTAVGNSFEDPLVAAISIDARPFGRTRSGVPVGVAGPEYAGSWVFTGSWFESNAGQSGRLAPRMVRVRGKGPGNVAPTGLTVRDCILVSGGRQVAGGSNCFVEYASALAAEQPVIVDNLRVGGSFINSVIMIRARAAGSSIVLRDTPLPRQIKASRGARIRLKR